MRRVSNQGFLPVVAGALALAITASYFRYYWSALLDDAFISFVYARNWLEHAELVFDLGERVEGYSNFFWIIILTTAKMLGFNFVLSARGISAFCITATVLVLIITYRHSPWRAFISLEALLMASHAEVTFWACSGLEGVVSSFALFLGVLLMARNGATAKTILLGGITLVIATLIRHEGAVFAAVCMLGGILLADRSKKPYFIAAMAVYGLLILPYHFWRLDYFGLNLSNSFHAKAGWPIFGILAKPFSWVGLGLLAEYGGAC